jgi:hypothetical protein
MPTQSSRCCLQKTNAFLCGPPLRRSRLIEFTAERGSYRGCRCATTRGTESCDEEEDDMEALVSEISKIGTTPSPKISTMYICRPSSVDPRGVFCRPRLARSRVLGGHVPDPTGLLLPGRGRLASCVVTLSSLWYRAVLARWVIYILI